MISCIPRVSTTLPRTQALSYSYEEGIMPCRVYSHEPIVREDQSRTMMYRVPVGSHCHFPVLKLGPRFHVVHSADHTLMDCWKGGNAFLKSQPALVRIDIQYDLQASNNRTHPTKVCSCTTIRQPFSAAAHMPSDPHSPFSIVAVVNALPWLIEQLP